MNLRKKVNTINPTDWNSKAALVRKRAAAVKIESVHFPLV